MLTDASYFGDKTMQLIYAGYEEVVGIYRIKVEYGNFKNDIIGDVGLNRLLAIIVMRMNLMRMTDMIIPSSVLRILLLIQITMSLFL